MDGAAASRRDFIRQAGFWTAAAALGGAPAAFAEQKEQAKEEPEVAPAEDLMREHGLLRRVLLIYGEAIRRIEAQQELPSELVTAAAWVVRSFIEDYHEKLEEDFLFPRFQKGGMLGDLVEILAQQHQGGGI